MADGDETSSLASSRKGKARATADDMPTFSSETTPLLSGSASSSRYDGEIDDAKDDDEVGGPHEAGPTGSETASRRSASRASSVQSAKTQAAGCRSFILAIPFLLLFVTIIIGLLTLPGAMEEYAKKAAVIEPTNLSLESITADGVRARVQANFRLDGSRVQQDKSRRIGSAVTWLVGKLGTKETRVSVYLPQFENVLLGTAVVPPLTINLRDGHTTAIDIVTDLVPGDADGIRSVANTWLEGRLDKVKLTGKANITVSTGIIPLGTFPVIESIVVEANKIPDLPSYNISRLVFHDVPGGVGADITVVAYNKYPIQLDIPELGFQVLVPNCGELEPFIPVAEAVTESTPVKPRSEVSVQVHGLIEKIPESLNRACPDSTSSPLDQFLKDYLHNGSAQVLVQGRRLPESNTPEWIGDILSSITVPVPFPGRSFDDMIKNFSLTDVDFQLPDPMADPDDPASEPTVSGTIEVLAGLPKELNLDLSVTHIKATANVLYRGKKFGELNIKDWQKAASTRVKDPATGEQSLMIKSRVEDVPLTITDEDVFTRVVQALLFGGRDVILDIAAAVDVKVETVLGELVLKEVPTEGKIPVKPLPGDSLVGKLRPSVGGVRVLKTTETAIHIEAVVNITNPTPYTATVPFFTAHVLKNGSVIGDATIRNARIAKGTAENLVVSAVWEPSQEGEAGRKIGKDLISEYLSGRNITITVQPHEGSIPSAPSIGRALSKLPIEVSAPKLTLPPDPNKPDEEDGARFIRDATFHVFSSTATFTLVSPFRDTTLLLEWVNATAYYNHTEPVGRIDYDDTFAVPPGASRTPKLPVEWSVGSIGYGAVRRALGGRLELDALADVTVRLGSYRETIWYVGRGIGASIRP